MVMPRADEDRPERAPGALGAPGKRVAANEEWLQIRLPRDAKRRLQAWSDETGVSMSILVRRLILEAFAQGRDARGELP